MTTSTDIKAPCGKSFEDFYRLCKSYHKELKSINLNNETLSKDDLIVLNDLIKEITAYTTEHIKLGSNTKATQFVEVNTKIIDVLLLISNNVTEGSSNSKKMSYILSLKLNNLENKFQILYNEDKYEDAEKVLMEIINIQEILKLPQYNIANSVFYLAVIKYCKIPNDLSY
jgi:hypothetical protein